MNKNFRRLEQWWNFVQFQKVWYPQNQLDEIYQIKSVPYGVREKGRTLLWAFTGLVKHVCDVIIL